MIFRHSKTALVAAAAFYFTLVVFNNLTDYGSNYGFVSHVLQMDTTFPENQGMWRAIHVPGIYHVAYACIILTEAVIAVLCWAGAVKLWRPEIVGAVSAGKVIRRSRLDARDTALFHRLPDDWGRMVSDVAIESMEWTGCGLPIDRHFWIRADLSAVTGGEYFADISP